MTHLMIERSMEHMIQNVVLTPKGAVLLLAEFL